MAEISESFDKADGPLGPDLTWTDVTPGWAVVSNRARPSVGGWSQCYARAEHDLTSVDHYAEATVTALSNDATEYFGPCVRFQSATNSSYMLVVEATSASTSQARIVKTIAGTTTDLTSSVAVSIAPPFVVRTETEGATIRGYVDGALVATAVDTDLASGTRVGVYGNTLGIGDVTEIDNFAAGALPPSDRGFRVGTLAGPARVAAPTPTGPALRRTLTGPALARTVTGPEI